MDPFYLAAAVVVCAVGAWLTSNLFFKASSTIGQRRTILALLAGLTGGCTIWTTHFVWMLGTEFHFSHSYAFDATICSLLLAIMFSCVSFHIAALSTSLIFRAVAGVVLGTGMAVMHFVGMTALALDGVKEFDGRLVVLACALGLGFSVLCLCWSTALKDFHPKMGTAVLFVFAVATLHYTGMSSLTVTPMAQPAGIGELSDRNLFIAVILMIGLIMAIGAAAYALDSQNSTQRLMDLSRKAYRDPLTDLPNRAMLADTLPMASTLVNRHVEKMVIVNFDLNRFKDINDVHGHSAGDAVLATVASRLKEAEQSGETVFRIGGDEFVAIKRAVRTLAEAEAFSLRLRDAILPEIHWEGKVLTVGSSLGVALFPDHGDDMDDLLVKADLAMYRSKRDRTQSPVFYDSSIDEENRDRSALSLDLRNAIENGEFELCYQKQNAISDESVVGYEVLLRWVHRERGNITPEAFIPIAERDGIINEIGEWVLRTACKEAAAWKTPMKIAVNVAARQLSNDAFPSVVRSALEDSGLDSSKLEIEITESGIIADVAQAHKIVDELKSIGVSIVMDDFGKGYSSLSTLQSFPFDKIKIDKDFVRDVATSSQAQAIVRSTIGLGKALRIAVLAEGVENQEDLDFLKSEGCGQVQGFLFGEPIPSRKMKAA